VAYLRRLNSETDAINKNISEIVVFSNGSVSWTEAWNMSLPQRTLIIKTLNNYNQLKQGKSVVDDL
jgi:uncharacterized Rmd1/YagE family protein